MYTYVVVELPHYVVVQRLTQNCGRDASYLATGRTDHSMKYRRTALLLATAIFSGIALSAGAFANAVPTQQAERVSPTIASVVDSEVSSVEKQILDVAEAMPEDKFNFSPESLNIRGSDYKGVRSFAVQLKHVAASNYFIWSPLAGDKPPEGLND